MPAFEPERSAQQESTKPMRKQIPFLEDPQTGEIRLSGATEARLVAAAQARGHAFTVIRTRQQLAQAVLAALFDGVWERLEAAAAQAPESGRRLHGVPDGQSPGLVDTHKKKTPPKKGEEN